MRRYRSREASTSSLDISLPLWKCTPWRSLKVKVFWSGLISMLCASCGMGEGFLVRADIDALRQLRNGCQALVAGDQRFIDVDGNVARRAGGRDVLVEAGDLG